MNTTKPESGRFSIRAFGAEHSHSPRRLDPLLAWLCRLAAIPVAWHQRARQRSRLAELDDRFLHDIGKTRKEAIDEATKPFWRP
jgi:uncharacterized protein YjiS (DUF1127 family)